MSANAVIEASTIQDRSKWMTQLVEVNRELWLVLSLIAIAGLLNWLLAAHTMILGLYTLPTIFSAYVYGRRHAVMTAVASVCLVVALGVANPTVFGRPAAGIAVADRWFELVFWGSVLILTAYAMGTLYERKEGHLRELRRTYFGVLTILQQFISNDKYTHNHSYRVSLYASNIATRMGFSEERVDDIRAAGLLHDIGKLETSRDILYKASTLTPEEMFEMRDHLRKGLAILEPLGGALSRILPIILAHHERYDGSGYLSIQGEKIPIEARVLAVADAYDTLTSDRPYRRAVTPFEARKMIVGGSGTNFDPQVVDAFAKAFDAGQMEIPDGLVR